MMAEALLEECLQENMGLLRSSTPLMDKTQPRLCRAKSHLNTILSRGRLTVSQAPLGHTVAGDSPPPPPSFMAEPVPSSRPPAQVFERGPAVDGQSALCAGPLPGRPGNVCQGGTGGADKGRPADLPPPPAGRGFCH